MNMQALMAQAQKMRRDVMKKKEEIDKKLFTGKSEWVEVTLSGNKRVVNMNIKKDGGYDEEDVEALEDMLKIAINNALTDIDNEMEKAMGQYGGAFDGLF